MSNKLYPCIWLDGKGREAADYYCHVFGNGKIIADTPMIVTFELSGQKFMALNGGPQFTPTEATSFFVVMESKEEVEKVWEQLNDGGSTLMPLDKYDWSELYGWVQDKFGISWQIAFGKLTDVHNQKFVTTFMYCGEHQGKAEAAVNFYATVFPKAFVEGILKYPEDSDTPGQVMHSQFILNDVVFGAMDSGEPQPFTFTAGISNVVECDTQDEIDHYWNAFTKEGKESNCGWCQDQFGVWWQVIPSILKKLMGDPAKAGKVAEAYMQMKKFDIAALEAVR